MNDNLRERAAAARYDMAHFEMLLTSQKSFMLDTLDYIETPQIFNC